MIVIIYPRTSNLPQLSDEIQDLISTVPDCLPVEVYDSERPIFHAIDKLAKDKRGVRGIWFAGHAGLDTVELGQVKLSVSALVTYIRAIQADWVVFNTCYGDFLAKRVRVETGVATLGANVEGGEIEDKDAWRMAGALARSLVRHDMDLGEAYKELDPRGGGQYLYREALDTMPNRYSVNEDGLDVVEEIHQIKLRLALLEQQVDLKLSSIAQDVAQIREQSATRSTGVSWNAVVIIIILSFIYFTILTGFIAYTGGL